MLVRNAPTSSKRAAEARPAVLVYCALAADDLDGARQLDAGMEEEGVPARIVTVPDGPAVALAHAAAQASNLDVGVGIDSMGNISVHHAKMPRDRAALNGSPGTARVMGHNAARLVRGTPFKLEVLDPATEESRPDLRSPSRRVPEHPGESVRVRHRP